jgi:hypothetical protein
MIGGELGYSAVTATSTAATLVLPGFCHSIMIINDGPNSATFRLFDTHGTVDDADASSALIKAGEAIPFEYQRAASDSNRLGYWKAVSYWSVGSATLRIYTQ